MFEELTQTWHLLTWSFHFSVICSKNRNQATLKILFLLQLALAENRIPSGLFSDSLRPKKTVTVFILVAALGAILFGLSPISFTAITGRAQA